MPGDKHDGSVSKTQEYAYADYCIGRLAQHLGETETAAEFAERGGWYANLWDPDTQFFRARTSDGSFIEPFKTEVRRDRYVEGDAWQYLFYAPHDPAGLAALMGGWSGLVDRLDLFFGQSKEKWNDLIPSPFYFHGNEPDIHAPFLYSFAGDPDRTGQWVSWIVEKNYSNTPAGLAGNDDAGTLSAWYVFAALGLYPIACLNQYALFPPLAASATLHLHDGKTLDITRTGEGPHLESIQAGGTPLPAAFIEHGDLLEAGSLVFTLGDSAPAWKRAGE